MSARIRKAHCPYCGSPVYPTDDVCVHCGRELLPPQPVQASPPQAQHASAPPVVHQPPSTAMPTAPHPVPHAATPATHQCPVCHGLVAPTAIQCPHCGHQLRQPKSLSVAILLWLLLPGAGFFYLGDSGAGLLWLIGILGGAFISFVLSVVTFGLLSFTGILVLGARIVELLLMLQAAPRYGAR